MNRLFSQFFLFVFLVSFAFIIMDYRGLGHSDTNEFGPLFYRLLDSNYLKNDWFINISSNNFNVRLYFIYMLFFFSKIIGNIPLLYFLLYSAAIIIAAASVYLCSQSLFKNKESSFLNVFLVLFGATFSLGGILIFTSNLSSFLVSISLSMLGFYFLINKRLNYFSIFLGLATLIHFVSGNIIFGLLFAASFISSKKDKKEIKKYSIALLIFFLFSIATIPNLLADKASSAGFNALELREIVGEIRAPHHYLPFEWPITRYLEFGLFLILFLVSLKESGIDKENRKFVLTITYLLLALIAVSIFFVEIYPIKLFIKLNLFRLTTFFVFIEYLFVGNFIYTKMRKEAENKDFKFFIYPLLILSVLSNHLILASVPLFLLYLKFENKIKISSKTFYICLALGIAFFAVILSIDAVTLFLKTKANTIIYLIFSIIVLLPLTAHSLFRQRIIKNLAFASIIFSIIAFGLFNYPILYEPAGNYQQVYNFIKENTPKEAIFLTPPGLNSFRLGAERAIVADFKSFPFGEKEMLEWKERMLDISGKSNFSETPAPEKQIIAGYEELSKEQVVDLRDKYDASYALFNKPKSLNIKIVYQDEYVVLYGLK